MKILAYALFILLLVPFQVTVLESVSPFGIRPDLCLITACLAGFVAGQVHGFFLGVFLGFVQDFFFAGTLWLNTLTKAVVGYAAGVLAKHLSNTAFYSVFLPMLLFSFVSGMVFLLASRRGMDMGEVVHGFSAILVPQAMLDGVVAVVANWVIARWIVPAPSA